MNKLLATALVSLAALGITASNASAGVLSGFFGGCHSCTVKIKVHQPNAFTPACSPCYTSKDGSLPGFGGQCPYCGHGGHGQVSGAQGFNGTFINGSVIPPGAVIVNPSTPVTPNTTQVPAPAQPTNPVAAPRAFVPQAYPYNPYVGYNGQVVVPPPQGWNGAR